MKIHIIIILISFFMISCSGEKTEEKKVEDIKNAFVLSKQEVSNTMELPAELLPYERAGLSAKVEAYVEKMLADIGDRVKKGDILILLDAPEMIAQYAEANARYHEAEAIFNASLDKYSRLRKASGQEGVVAKTDVINARNRMLADSAGMISARSRAQAYHQLQTYLTIRAPFNGIITRRYVDPGDLVGISGKTNLITIERPDLLRVRVHIPESFVKSIPAENVLPFTVDALKGQVFNAVLKRRSGSIDPDTRTELWEYEYENKEGILKPGMYAMAKLELNRPETSFVVPYSAVVTSLEKKFVIRVNDQAEWVDVKEGIDTGYGVEIFGNLKEGDTLLSRGSEELKPGTTVKINLIGP